MCHCSSGYSVYDVGFGAVGDQIWMLQAARAPVILRTDGVAFKLVTQVSIKEPPQTSIAARKASLEHFTELMKQTPVRIRII